MIQELAILDVVRGEEAKFRVTFEQVQHLIEGMPGYISHQLSSCVENESRFLLSVYWQNLEDHTEGFRGSEEYLQWKEALHHFYTPFPIVEHYKAVLPKRSESRKRDRPCSVDWAAIVEQINNHIGSHCIYLEARSKEFIRYEPDSTVDDKEIVAVVVAYVVEDVESWDTKEPAQRMAETLSQLLDRKLPILLSRESSSFTGYYVRIGV